MTSRRTITILSGGMDSATLCYFNHEHDMEQTCLTFNYGQRHVKEIESAKRIAAALGLPHHVVDLAAVGALLKGSALTDAVAMPYGHYAEANMKLTVVPNRNAIMLAIAYAVAVAEAAEFVSYGAHAGDHLIYPDCRPPFVKVIEQAFLLGNEGFSTARLHVPFLTKTKGDIVGIGLALGVPYHLTWTCYEGGAVACGRCGACDERKAAFAEQGAVDPLEYLA